MRATVTAAGSLLACLGGEIVPAVEDGLLAEGGEALPVGGDPVPRLVPPLAGAGHPEQQLLQGESEFRMRV